MSDISFFLHQYGNALVFGSALLEQGGLPLPATPIFVAAGIAAGMGDMNLHAILGLAMAGFMLGDLVWFGLGRWRGHQILEFLCRISLEPDSCVRHTEERFLRHGASALVFAKFVPGINTVIRPLAAISGMSLPTFLFYDGLGTVLYVGTFVGIGYLFSDRADDINRWIGSAHRGVTVGVLLLLTGYLLYRYLRRRQFLKKLDAARISSDDLKGKLDSGKPVVIVDLRSPLEKKAFPYTLPGARSMTAEEVKLGHPAFLSGSEIVLYCDCPGEAGSAQAAHYLQKHGYQARPLANGIAGWKDKNYPMEALSGFPSSSPRHSVSRGPAAWNYDDNKATGSDTLRSDASRVASPLTIRGEDDRKGV